VSRAVLVLMSETSERRMPRSFNCSTFGHTAKTLTFASAEVYRQSVTASGVVQSHNMLKTVLTL